MKRRWAYFWVQGFPCAPADISRILLAEPSDVWIVGETVLSHGRVAWTNAWRYESTLGDERALDEHIENVLTRVEPRLPALRNQVRPLELGVNCVAYLSEYQGNGFHLSAALIARLAALELSVDFDLYGNTDIK